MEWRKTIIFLMIAIFLFSIAAVSASDVDDMEIASEDANQIELSANNEMNVDNLKTSEENTIETQAKNNKSMSAALGSKLLDTDTGTFSGLSSEIGSGGNIELQHDYYTYDSGDTIEITLDNTVIDGKGAIIDMDRSTNIQPFYVTASGVTFKNLTIQNANYDGSGCAIYFSSSATSGTVTNCNFTNNTATNYGGAVLMYSGSVENCNFTNNTATNYGGAVYFQNTGEVTNCNFTNNTATYYGGAVYFQNTGEVTNCNFTNNKATEDYSDGGAVYFFSTGEVTNCNFTNNKATGDHSDGGAVYFRSTGNVTNCNFVDNSANRAGAIFSKQEYTAADTCIFKRNSGGDSNVVIYPPTLDVDDFTTFYGSGEKLRFDLKTNISNVPVTNGNISISVYFKNNETWVVNSSCLSGEGWIPDLPVGSYIAVFNTEYEKFQEINRTVTIEIPNVEYYINVSSLTSNNRTVNITAKSDIPKDIPWDGKLLFILPNGTQINANYAGNGTWWAVHTFDYGVYQISASYYGLDDVTVKNATIAIKLKTELTSNAITTTYNINKNLVITLKDSTGKALSGVSVTVDLNGAKTYTTDKNGQVKVSTKGLAPKAYTAKVTFNGNTKYAKSTKDIKVTVKKATPKLTAKKKTFKRTVKTKKYTIVLKDNTGKAMIKVKVTLKIKGKKTITVKTNSKGKATFKIKKLTKKGTYKSTVTFKGNKYYNKVVKKVKIKIK